MGIHRELMATVLAVSMFNATSVWAGSGIVTIQEDVSLSSEVFFGTTPIKALDRVEWSVNGIPSYDRHDGIRTRVRHVDGPKRLEYVTDVDVTFGSKVGTKQDQFGFNVDGQGESVTTRSSGRIFFEWMRNLGGPALPLGRLDLPPIRDNELFESVIEVVVRDTTMVDPLIVQSFNSGAKSLSLVPGTQYEILFEYGISMPTGGRSDLDWTYSIDLVTPTPSTNNLFFIECAKDCTYGIKYFENGKVRHVKDGVHLKEGDKVFEECDKVFEECDKTKNCVLSFDDPNSFSFIGSIAGDPNRAEPLSSTLSDIRLVNKGILSIPSIVPPGNPSDASLVGFVDVREYSGTPFTLSGNFGDQAFQFSNGEALSLPGFTVALAKFSPGTQEPPDVHDIFEFVEGAGPRLRTDSEYEASLFSGTAIVLGQTSFLVPEPKSSSSILLGCLVIYGYSIRRRRYACS